MKTLSDAAARDEILGRLERLSHDAPARWGTMDCPRMLAHLADALRMGTGELPVAFKKSPLSIRLVRWLVIHHLPFPRGTPTAPALIGRAPGEWRSELDAVRERVAGFRAERTDPWPIHPIFGTMSGRDWATLTYRHIDHHLRQFGA
ncbi:MAG: hypothetical protein JWM27_3201 [Gemmatimonadetes bacterium]|nr:hypothetical protein [Gemmatimonadota bacterium]